MQEAETSNTGGSQISDADAVLPAVVLVPSIPVTRTPKNVVLEHIAETIQTVIEGKEKFVSEQWLIDNCSCDVVTRPHSKEFNFQFRSLNNVCYQANRCMRDSDEVIAKINGECRAAVEQIRYTLENAEKSRMNLRDSNRVPQKSKKASKGQGSLVLAALYNSKFNKNNVAFKATINSNTAHSDCCQTE